MSKRAWVTLATNDSYGLGALVLAHSLRRTGSVYPAVVLITPSVTQSMRDRLSAVFAEVITVDVLDSKDAAHLALLQRPELGITFTKIHCWNLTQYEKCVFLDADTLVVQNSDELFERVELSAAPDVGWPDCFNSGVFVFQPSPETFEKLVKFAQERGSFDGGDQGLLNSFFSDWAHGDINKHLPFVYNVTSAAFYSYLPALKHYGQNLKIIHFIGAGKPWLQQYNWEAGSVEAPEHLREFLQLWWDLFVANVHAQLDVSMSGVAGNLARVVPGTTGFQREALDELTRRQGWEAGNIDYMGADSFDNIWAKISQTLSQPRSSSPKQSPPRESSPQKQSSPIKESAPQPEKADDGRNVTQKSVKVPVEIGQEAVSLIAPVTNSPVAVTEPVPKTDVIKEGETLAKDITSEEIIAIETTLVTVDVVKTSDTVDETLTKVKDDSTVETQTVPEVPISEGTVTKESLSTPVEGQTFTPLNTSAPTDTEGTVLEKDIVLDTSVSIVESESQVKVTDTSVPIEPKSADVVEPPVLGTAAVSVSAELPVSKEQLESEVDKTSVVEANVKDNLVTAEIKVSDVKELGTPKAPENTILSETIVPTTAISPTPTLADKTMTKDRSVVAKTPSSVTSDTPIDIVTPVKAQVPETLAARPFEAVTSQASDKNADIPASVEALPSETVTNVGDKGTTISMEEPSKKIDISKVPHTPPTTPKSTPEATTPVAESVLKTDPLDTTQKITASIETATESLKTIDTPIVTPASPVSTDISSPTAPIVEATPEKPSEVLVATDSPPLANTPSKEEAPALPAAKSTEEAAQETRL